MNTRKLRSTLIGSLSVALALASGSALAISFRLTELTLGGEFSRGNAINASGQVAGDSFTTTSGFSPHAFLWDGTRMVDLGTLGTGANSGSTALNDSGQVTGIAYTSVGGNAVYHAFLWDGTTMQDLGTLEGTGLVLAPPSTPRGRWRGTWQTGRRALPSTPSSGTAPRCRTSARSAAR